MHIRDKNLHLKYEINDQELGNVKRSKKNKNFSGISNDLIMSDQCTVEWKKIICWVSLFTDRQTHWKKDCMQHLWDLTCNTPYNLGRQSSWQTKFHWKRNTQIPPPQDKNQRGLTAVFQILNKFDREKKNKKNRKICEMNITTITKLSVWN